MGKLKRVFKPTKKKVIITVSVIIAAAIAIYFLSNNFFKANTSVMTRSFTRTTTLAKTDLSETVSVTGSVESSSVTNITSSANYKVKEILVQEGDTVINGQKLAALDTEDLEEQIADAKEKLANNKKQLQSAYDNAVSKNTEALNSYNTAQSDYNTALADFTPIQTKYNAAVAAVATQQQIYNSWYQQYITDGNALNSAIAAQQVMADTLTTQYRADHPEMTAEDVNNAVLSDTRYTSLVSATASAQQKYDETSANYKNASDRLNDAKKTNDYDNIEKSYTSAKNTYDNASSKLTSAQSSYKSSSDSVSTAKDNLANLDTSSLEDLQKTLDDCIITSTADGTVTAVNAVVGSYVSSGTGGSASSAALFVIQNTGSLKISVTIDEYDIKKITTGMTAEITSDATGETVITGHVSQISQTATTSNSSTGFSAEITVDTADSGLLIGMNATVDIIISGKNDVYAVPYDAVGKDDDGNSVIYVKNDSGEFEPIIITTGEETDYYIEIIGDELKDGMEVRSSADETSIDAAASAQSDAANAGVMMSGGSGGMVMASDAGGGADRGAPPSDGGGGGPMGG